MSDRSLCAELYEEAAAMEAWNDARYRLLRRAADRLQRLEYLETAAEDVADVLRMYPEKWTRELAKRFDPPRG